MKIEDVADAIRRDIAGMHGAPRGAVAAAAAHTAAARRAELHATPSPDQPAAAAAFANALAPLKIVYGTPRAVRLVDDAGRDGHASPRPTDPANSAEPADPGDGDVDERGAANVGEGTTRRCACYPAVLIPPDPESPGTEGAEERAAAIAYQAAIRDILPRAWSGGVRVRPHPAGPPRRSSGRA